MIKRDEASERQIQAADPRASTWLSANAGSGKTRVLTDRVARMLLDGVAPEKILCLTYTKAAASEMQNRLFQRLGQWAMAEDAALVNDLERLGIDLILDQATLRSARQLFARAIETPGGLKIQTIHSFCASLLRRFPLEAGVSPQFSEMDDRSAKMLRTAIIDEMAGGSAREEIDGLARFYSGEDFNGLMNEVSKHRGSFENERSRSEIWADFGLSDIDSLEAILQDVAQPGTTDVLHALLRELALGGANDKKAHAKIAHIDPDHLRIADIRTLEGIFLFGASAASPYGAKVGKFPTKKTREAIGMDGPLDDLMARIEGARTKRIGLAAAERSLVLHRFADAFLPRYHKAKQLRGWLDFDDLILAAKGLLSDPMVAQWVLYRLDGGIDHILVDEAQDTSPTQWAVIEQLAHEFTAGEGARADQKRTIFVVGDPKQSIYSFQGADPAGFGRMKDKFARRLEAVDQSLNNLQLEYSFRSSAAILGLVDATFHAPYDEGFGETSKHRAFKFDMPGRVDLWPALDPADAPPPRDWMDTVDQRSESDPKVVLARNIAAEIKRMIDEKAPLPHEIGHSGTYEMRPVRPGDFLILVRKRSGVFSEIIRACKEAKLDIAGADVLKVGAELAVKDITALLRFLALPEDSLSLAAALRSPIFGWSENELYDVAQGRSDKYLWETLRKREDHPETLAILGDMLNQADFLRPFEIIERLLTVHDGRRKLIGRLGEECVDGVDALLTQSLTYEQSEPPSLTGFLTWLDSDEMTIKRQIDSASDQIRVMTVHGSKGLEAPIVILPDTFGAAPSVKEDILAHDGALFWKVPAGDRPKAMSDAHDRLKLVQEQENMRLLYVAMTRAEKWLIVAGARGQRDGKPSWYDIIGEGMSHIGAVNHHFALGDGQRHSVGDWTLPMVDKADDTPPSPVRIPDWIETNAPTPAIAQATLAPSDLGGAKALPGDTQKSEEESLRRGLQIHLLLEHLPSYPRNDWPDTADRLLQNASLVTGTEDHADILSEVTQVLTNPDLSYLFNGNALAEVDITAPIDDLSGRRIFGTVDRLLITDDVVTVVDFKSNIFVPATAESTPEGIVRQMAAYHAALVKIYPDREIKAAVLWTRHAKLIHIPHKIMREALLRTPTP